jgi:motility quorum-sensing regulator/GCU-specific mRNA interferase toxin
MEKRTPHRSLSVVKAMVEAGKVRSTFSALAGAAELGLDFDGMLAVILALSPADFHMPTIGSGRTSTAQSRARARCI